MTDRELLELAAKAAGIDIPKKLNSWLTYDDHCGFQWWNMDGTRTEKVFNPLTDDGDALRLAVKLQISPIYGWPSVAVCAFSRGESDEKDPYAATRRAIVRAAAEIGKTMQ